MPREPSADMGSGDHAPEEARADTKSYLATPGTEPRPNRDGDDGEAPARRCAFGRPLPGACTPMRARELHANLASYSMSHHLVICAPSALAEAARD